MGFGASLVTALLTATACTSVVDGTAQRPPGESSRPSVDVALLDTGNYATQPVPPMGVAGSPAKGGLIEAGRMAEHVVGPWEVNPELSHFVMPTSIVKDVAALKMLLPEKVAAAAAKHNFVTGFSSARRTEPDRASLVNAVLRFPDPQAAAAAAAEFGDITLQPDLMDYVPQARPVSVREHPETRASTYDLPQLGSPIMETNVNAYTAHGPFVLVQSAESPDGVDPTADMVAKTLDQQIAAIDAFTPTAVSELANLPVDASGVLARTVPEIKENPPPGVNQTYGPHAAPHFQTFPQTSAELFADTGMDVWSRGRAAVYRVRDEQSAANMLEQFATELTNAKGQAVASVPNMPDSRCIRREAQLSTYVTCFAVADRYVIEAASPQPTDAHQLTAAQYVMLTAP
ncbi:hypothetical protein AU184_21765 [Mycolicibacterium novocastrense]|uniref:DUF7373 family lipoprotein n=1 Tax=Mycolicibacterium novocastrense TaxID=59813 RepID=UPI00074A9EED|nr:hypothetical protein [Mycolicibacterium novocastrense]KUH65290.1 hypothetical protein AU183_20650 [Mycolicibacterium novocastrense]KUH75484.1 hypothetical protein AU072_20495 [Mycolicibacterium novocastrense]KUH77795.1 hypothetical protein AU184_21765 [Mycolicibacterium novocastrense]